MAAMTLPASSCRQPQNILLDISGRIRVSDFGLPPHADPTEAGLTYSRGIGEWHFRLLEPTVAVAFVRDVMIWHSHIDVSRNAIVVQRLHCRAYVLRGVFT